jgi:hypothetical protein
LNETDIQAGYGGIVNVSLTAISGAIGIAIATLSAASVTANAVWIAGLGAGASGIGIFQGVFGNEAINKDTLSDYKKNLAKAAGDATLEVNFPQWRASVLKSNTDWTDGTIKPLGEQMNKLQKAVLFTFQDIQTKPTAGGEDAKTSAGGEAAKAPAGGAPAAPPKNAYRDNPRDDSGESRK